MARKLPKLRAELMAEIEAAWVQPQDAWDPAKADRSA